MEDIEEMELSNSENPLTDDKNEDENALLQSDEDDTNLETPECENDGIPNEECDEEEDDDDADDRDEAEVKQLESNLSQNPYDYTSHVALIKKLQEMADLDRLRSARENMSSKYPLSPDLWLEWLRDEMKLVATQEEREAVEKLCERAIKDYLSVEIWLEYLQFNIGSMGTEQSNVNKVRELFERALTAAGLHVTKGAIIWEAFREFEMVLVSLASTDSEKKVQLDRVANLFRRQLGCPLLDMEKTWDEYRTWRAEEGKEATVDDNTVSIVYKRALDNLSSRLPFEEKLLSSQNESELLDYYKAYLLYEKQHGDPGRVTVLYERSLTDLSLQAELWLDYIDYVEKNLKIETMIASLYERATRNVTWCSKIWIKWLRQLEKWEKPLLEIQRILEMALVSTFQSAEDYRNIWLTYLEYLRRRIDSSSSERKKNIEIIEKAFERAYEYLSKAFGIDGDPQCIVLQFWARTEAIHANNMEKTRILWADILSQGHSEMAASWLEYISIEKCYGDTKHLRKLYQRALAAVKDWPESIANSWIEFERDEGSLEQIEACEVKVKEKLEKTAVEREKSKTVGEVSTRTVEKKVTKRKQDDTKACRDKLVDCPKKSRKVEKSQPKVRENTVQSGERESDRGKVTPPPGFSGPPPGFNGPPPGFNPPDENSMEMSHEIDENISIFVSNLDYATTEEEVRQALIPVGPITLFRMVKDYKGRSKGFCYVQLSSAGAVAEALKLDRTPINGRPMFISRCNPNKSSRGNAFKYSSVLEKNKLFVKGLPATTTKEDLEELFKPYGAIKDIRLVTYRNGHSKGLAYVDFEDENCASKAVLATDGMTIEDKVISVAISKPPERKKNSPEEPLIRSLGGSSTSRTHFGVPKTILSMVPRSVKPAAANGNAANKANANSMSNNDFRMLLSKKQ